MATLSAPTLTVSNGSKFDLFGLGESALRLALVAALPISATIFFIQSF
jgi:hypothetical protein